MALHSASITKLTSLCRALLPLSNSLSHHGAAPELTLTTSPLRFHSLSFSMGIPQTTGPGPQSGRTRRRRSLMVQATSSQRWTLDDVERISRGKASKAKTGSRAVPHRLQAGERTAYDLAKKKGYLVQRAVSRKYPLVNTYRNFCDASSRMCIFIQQGPAGTDTVVIDLTPLRLSGDALLKLTEQVTEIVDTVLRNSSQNGLQAGEDSEGIEGEDDSVSVESQEEGEAEAKSTGILRFRTGRSEAKAVSQAAWDFWQSTQKSGNITSSD